MKRYATICGLTALALLCRVNPLSAAPKPEEFLAHAFECNDYVVSLGTMADENGTNDDVKAFGKRVAAEHNRMRGEVTQMAKEKKFSLASGTNKDHRDRLAELKKTGKGEGYDRKVLGFLIDEHEKAVKELEACSKDADADAACKACAQKNLATVRKHLEEAQALQKKLGS